ncbi:MAG: DUF2721 domain-containing protein [Verrucomicrobiota bacterium]
MNFHALIPILQTAIGPVILISGVGLLLLSMTNRFGRVIDRSRQLAESLRKTPEPQGGRLSAQLQILFRRARLVRLAITLATISVLLAALLIIALFLIALFQLELGLLITILFIACLGSIIASLLVFLQDINLSLVALKLETDIKD